tara:strand:- start:2536 stop:3534 length:999 start_codon:yes stop_codon:yes gene_type:complete
MNKNIDNIIDNNISNISNISNITNNISNNNLPWCEKYRPIFINNIIMNDVNKEIINNMLLNNNIPNLLLYGPPGSGKTTTILNIINKYYKNIKNFKSLVIHLNASDDRGIDIIRNTIYNFIYTKSFSEEKTRFIILDEADYMTKIAQQALKILIQENNKNIIYCLICNYISKIDYSLQNEFIKLRFNNLPTSNIINLMNNIIKNENLNISKNTLRSIIEYYNNDVRCMINYLQTNINKKVCVLENNYLNNLYNYNVNKNFNKFNNYINIIENKCNIDKFYIIKQYIYYIMKYKLTYNENNITKIKDYEFCIHNYDSNDNYIKYIYYLTINCH